MPEEKNKLIRINGVSHTFTTDTGTLPVLKNLTLSVAKNGFTAIVGPSGCGKSTVTRLVAGLLKPDSGNVWLQGQRVTSPRDIVGMAFQNPVLLEWRSILKNVMLPLEIVPNTLSPAAREARARDLLKLVGLSGFEHKRPSELSGGMRQRASYAGHWFIAQKFLFLMSHLARLTPSPVRTFGKLCTDCARKNLSLGCSYHT